MLDFFSCMPHVKPTKKCTVLSVLAFGAAPRLFLLSSLHVCVTVCMYVCVCVCVCVRVSVDGSVLFIFSLGGWRGEGDVSGGS